MLRVFNSYLSAFDLHNTRIHQEVLSILNSSLGLGCCIFSLFYVLYRVNLLLMLCFNIACLCKVLMCQ